MAYANGTATSNTDLWTKLISFLTGNSALVAAGQAWSIVWGSGTNIVLRGPGGGSENIYIGLVRTDSVDTDANSITIYGMTGINASATSMSGHVNVSRGVRVWLDAGSMRYWFVASGRRFVFAVNMSTVYQIGYAGFFLPYAPPTVYPYPMLVGGCSGTGTDVTSWRSSASRHAAFPQAPETTSATDGFNAYMLSPDAMWLGAASGNGAPVCFGPNHYNTDRADGSNPFRLSENVNTSDQNTGFLPLQSRIMRGYGDVYTLDPITLMQTDPDVQHHGILDGLKVCPGVGNAAENTIEIGSTTHLVLQNVFRTSTVDYMALALE